MQNQQHTSSGNESCASHQQTKINNNNNNGTPIIGLSNCGKRYLMIYILLQKQEKFYLITKSLNQNYSIKAQAPDEILRLG